MRGDVYTSLDEAIAAADKFAAENPESNGWNCHVTVLNEHPMYWNERDTNVDVVYWARPAD